MMPVQKRFGDVWRCHCMVSTAAVEFLRMPVQLLCRHPSLQAKLTHMSKSRLRQFNVLLQAGPAWRTWRSSQCVGVGVCWSQDREREIETEREREREKEREREGEREGERVERGREGDRKRERERQSERERGREGGREGET